MMARGATGRGGGAISSLLALVAGALAVHVAGQDTIEPGFQNKPIAWVEKQACGEYRVQGTFVLCGLSAQEAITALQEEYRPKAGQTIYEYAINRYETVDVTSIDALFNFGTVLAQPTTVACGGMCCCSSPTQSRWEVNVGFVDEEEAKAFELYLSDTLAYYLTYIKGTCSAVDIGVAPQPCPKFSVRANIIICDAELLSFITQVATEAKFNGLTLFEHLTCKFPSMTSPANVNELLVGLSQVNAPFGLGGCNCEVNLLWQMVTGFVSQEEAVEFASFITATYPQMLSTESGFCSYGEIGLIQATDAIYTAKVSTQMCVSDDGSIEGLDGESGKYDYLIKMLREGYSPVGALPIMEYVKQQYPSLIFPIVAEQLANTNNVKPTGLAWQCMDQYATCCCANPVQWDVVARFATKIDADYFAQYMSRIVPAYLSEVQKICTVNTFKGLLDFTCQCEQILPSINPACPISQLLGV